MKLKPLVLSLFFLFTLTGIAQNTEDNTPEESRYFNLTFGINAIDNSNNTVFPFDGSTLNFRTPFFITAEQQIHKNWALALTLSTNKLEFDNPATTKPYFGTDLIANWFFDDLIFNDENVDLYVGLGAGMHTIDGDATGSFNFTGGFRYWVSEKVGISLQSIGKINKSGMPQVGSHYQFNLGVSYKFLRKEQEKNNSVEVPEDTPEERSLNTDKNTKRSIPEYNPNTNVTSTELAKTPEESEIIKNNVGNILNTKTLDTSTDGVKSEFHVVVYAFKTEYYLNQMKQILSEKGIAFTVIEDSMNNFNYISVAHFNTREEAHNYIDTKLDKSMFSESWVYEVK